MARGGYRQPDNPAPVSGPGSLSRRTDGGPGGSQPNRVAPGATQYGEAQMLSAGQSVAPLPAAAPGGGAGAAAAGPGRSPGGSVFTAPTGLPGEPITAGAATGPGASPVNLIEEDPHELLRMIYLETMDPDLRALLEGAENYGW